MKKQKGFHDLMGRIGPFAVVDIVGTIGAAYLISKAFKTNFIATTATLFVVGELVHVAFKVKTPVTEVL
jgi:multidrug resistance efflux pump